jgi:hypothetical protein
MKAQAHYGKPEGDTEFNNREMEKMDRKCSQEEYMFVCKT